MALPVAGRHINQSDSAYIATISFFFRQLHPVSEIHSVALTISHKSDNITLGQRSNWGQFGLKIIENISACSLIIAVLLVKAVSVSLFAASLARRFLLLRLNRIIADNLYGIGFHSANIATARRYQKYLHVPLKNRHLLIRRNFRNVISSNASFAHLFNFCTHWLASILDSPTSNIFLAIMIDGAIPNPDFWRSCSDGFNAAT